MMVDGRIAERRAEVRAERRRARLRRTLLVALLTVVVGAAIWFEQSEHATVLAVDVRGTVRLDPVLVAATSGVEVGDGAMRFLPSRAERRIASLTLVRSVDVSRPQLRSVLIVVTEREPVYTAVHRGTSVLIDRDGIVIDVGSDARLPVVRLSTAPPEPGELVASHAALANAHRVWTGLSGPLRSRVVELRAPDEDGLELVLGDAPVVRFGRAEMMEEKVRAMGEILVDVVGSDVTLIDVRVPGFPVVRVD
jgi:cell division septal protein FtsQ